MFGGGAEFGGWVVILARWVVVNVGEKKSLIEEREKIIKKPFTQ